MSTNCKSPRTIFLEAVENHTPETWRAFLDTACGDDDTLRLEVQRLLYAHSRTGPFTEVPAAAGRIPRLPLGPSGTLSDRQIPPGTTIGRYRLIEQIGEGGMGVVYVAEQTEPIHRRVALKIIRPGMDIRHVIARFEAERQTLALMEHPNIARI